MNNTSELLINIVTEGMPKRLIGMDQKVRSRLLLWDVGGRRHLASGGKAGSNLVV